MARRPLRIGLSARIYHPQPGATGLQSKSLHYLEQSVAHWVMSREVMVFMIPSVSGDGLLHRSSIRLSDYPQYLDGLVLQGGADISPQSYGEEPVQPEWAGDRLRDAYEMELLHEFMEAGKPVLGICRGHQLINVAFGGTLYQDIPTQLPQAIAHLDTSLYDRRLHAVNIVQGTHLARLYPGTTQAAINSIHHQAVKDVGRDLVVEAFAVPDGLVEAIRWRGPSYVFGMQWHPEFMALETLHEEQLDGKPILADFLDAVRRRKAQAAAAPTLAVA